MAPVTTQSLQETTNAVRKAEAANRTIQTQYKEAAKDLGGAIRAGNESMIKLYRPQLAKVGKGIADTLQLVEYAISRVQELQDDEDFMARRFAVVEQLLKGVSSSRTVLTKELVETKKLEQAAVDALGELTDDQEDATSEYARLEDIANDLEAKLKKIRPLAKQYEGSAKQAIAANDQKALTDARVALLDLKFGQLKLVAQGNMPKVKQFLKKYPNTELKTDADWLHDRFQSLFDDFEQYDKRVLALVKLGQIGAQDKRAESEDSEPVNIAKAAKVLGVATKDQPKLAKALAAPAGTAREKKLSALAEELGLEEVVGKKLVAKLVKAKVLAA